MDGGIKNLNVISYILTFNYPLEKKKQTETRGGQLFFQNKSEMNSSIRMLLAACNRIRDYNMA